MAVKLCISSQVKKKEEPTIVLAFPSVGLVGSIVGTYISKSEDFRLIGYVVGEEFAPLAAIHDYTPLPPVRIYYSSKHNLYLFLSEIVIPLSSSLELAQQIISFAKKVKAQEIIIIGGMAKRGKKAKDVFIVGSNKNKVNHLVSAGLGKSIKEGATTGVAGLVLGLSTVHNLECIALLAEADPDFADPSAALAALQRVKRILGIEIDESDLEEEVKRRKKREVLRTTAFQNEGLGPMYG